MRPIGFSTGALAYADFRTGVNILLENRVSVIELSALRQNELAPLIGALDSLDLSFFKYISFHAPSQLEQGTEKEVVTLLLEVVRRRWPVIVHPDVMEDFDLWGSLDELLFVENMDKRKSVGRTASELAVVFERLPKAFLCLDLGHARQVDPTMSEAALILERFGSRLGQLHISDVNSRSTHDPLTAGALMAFSRIAHLIPDEVPIVLESPVGSAQVKVEMELARAALSLSNGARRSTMERDGLRWRYS
jgi:hypothetical protein